MSEVKINEEFNENQPIEENSMVDDVQENGNASATERPSEEDILSPEQELEEAEKQIADLHDRILRAAAENENFKKRVERERLASLKYAGETIFREILPTVDNLERALDKGVVEGVDAEKNLKGLIEGVQLTLKSLLTTLEKFEVKAIKTVGEPFDPKHQEALTMAAHDTVPENHVITDFEKGYYYKDRLLRPAKVVVSSGENKE